MRLSAIVGDCLTNHLDALAKRGLPADALIAIKNAQADVSGDESLRWLTQLLNRDKHQTPILTIGAFSAARLEFVYGARKFLAQGAIIKDGVAIRAHPELLAAIKRGEVEVGRASCRLHNGPGCSDATRTGGPDA
jgi:hypothetical protein